MPQTHILLASLGLAPAVITETLWAMMNPGEPGIGETRRTPVFPSIVHIVTTHAGGRTHEDRSNELNARITHLYELHGEPAPKFIFDFVTQPGGAFLTDVRDQMQNILYANFITRIVAKYAGDKGSVIHMSLAGGRKSMSSYDHTAMMFFGRVQDELTHVLVDPPILEQAGSGFWYPGQSEKTLSIKDRLTGETIDIAPSGDLVKMKLVKVPFVRLGVQLPKGVPPEALDYGKLIDFIEFERSQGEVVFDGLKRTVSAAGETVKLSVIGFSILALLAIARKQEWEGFGPVLQPTPDKPAKGWVRKNDFSFGLSRDKTSKNTHRALKTIGLLLRDNRDEDWDSQLRRDDGPVNETNLINEIEKEAEGGTNNTGPPISKLKTFIEDKFKSPFIRAYLQPGDYSAGNGNGKIYGLNIAPNRIKLVNFTNQQLNAGAD